MQMDVIKAILLLSFHQIYKQLKTHSFTSADNSITKILQLQIDQHFQRFFECQKLLINDTQLFHILIVNHIYNQSSMHKKEEDLKMKIKKFIDNIQVNHQKALRNALTELQQVNSHAERQDLPIQQLHAKVQQVLPLERINQYRELKQRLRNNSDIILVVQRGQAATCAAQDLTKDTYNDITQSFRIFTRTLQSLNDFQQLSLQVQSGINFPTLRQQIYLQILGKVNKAIQASDLSAKRLRHVIQANHLPLKKDEVRKEGLGEEDRRFLLGCLYRENCLFTTRHYLQGMLEEEPGGEESLLVQYWEPTIKACSYLFISNQELRNLEEPAWMFEYLQHILNVNYKYLLQFICLKDLKSEITSSISRHFLDAAYTSLLQAMIERRFEEDLSNLNQFLLFNFLDELGKYQEKLASSFSVRPNLVEAVLIRLDASHQVLQRCLQYQHKWFQTKIFEDFINIDYSRINLKNLDAYNIVGNFLSLFQRLQRKFTNVLHPPLRKKIAKFYQGQVLQVVAHVKTSFDRIYNHSRLPKIDVLLSFKRIQNQMRSALTGLLQTQPQLQDELQREYHAFLEQYFQVCALQAVTPTHKKLHISLGDIMGYLCREDEQQHDKYLSAFGKIFQQWQSKMQQVLKFSHFQDFKVRSIFFKYLQATNFSSVGLNLYIKIFQPYLRFLFSEDKHRALISMITMRRDAFNQYIESHADSLTFLNSQERKQLQAFKRAELLVD